MTRIHLSKADVTDVEQTPKRSSAMSPRDARRRSHEVGDA